MRFIDKAPGPVGTVSAGGSVYGGELSRAPKTTGEIMDILIHDGWTLTVTLREQNAPAHLWVPEFMARVEKRNTIGEWCVPGATVDEAVANVRALIGDLS